jgi:hypothetical protein
MKVTEIRAKTSTSGWIWGQPLKMELSGATVSMWNIAPTSYAALSLKGLVVEVFMDVLGQWRTLEGVPRNIRTRRDGADLITDFEVIS